MMSEVLADFIAPYAGTADTKDDHQKLLTLAATAWNAALFPVDKRGSMLDEVLTTSFGDAPQSLKSELRAFINELIARKEAHFADNHRAIVDFTLQETRDGYHLSVASTLEGTPAE